MHGVASLAKPFKLSDLLSIARATFITAPRLPESQPAA
jgi:hypothetical protein